MAGAVRWTGKVPSLKKFDAGLMKLGVGLFFDAARQAAGVAAKRKAKKTGDVAKADNPLIDIPADAIAGLKEIVEESFDKAYWSAINQTSYDRLKSLLVKMIEDHASNEDIAKAIAADTSGIFSLDRARGIATTEVTTAMNSAHWTVMQSLAADPDTGVLGSEWLDVGDDHTRPTHSAARGQRVKAGGLFKVGGHAARFPGDPRLPAQERIRCRCVALEYYDDSEPTEKRAPREFSSTQFDLPEPLAGRVREMGLRIPDEHLAEDGREDQVHTTLKFGLHTNNADDIRRTIVGVGSITIQIGQASVFHASDFDVVKLEVHSESLRDLNAKISAELENTETHPHYQPHITIAYTKVGQGDFYAAKMNDLLGEMVTFDTLTFSNKDREHIAIQLAGAVAKSNPHHHYSTGCFHSGPSSPQASGTPGFDAARFHGTRATDGGVYIAGKGNRLIHRGLGANGRHKYTPVTDGEGKAIHPLAPVSIKTWRQIHDDAVIVVKSRFGLVKG